MAGGCRSATSWLDLDWTFDLAVSDFNLQNLVQAISRKSKDICCVTW